MALILNPSLNTNHMSGENSDGYRLIVEQNRKLYGKIQQLKSEEMA